MIKKKYSLAINMILILIALVIIVLIGINTSKYYQSYNEHKDYFNNNPNPVIESWMTPMIISRHFNITEDNISAELNLVKTEYLLRTSLYEICKKNNLNCTELVTRLNNLIK